MRQFSCFVAAYIILVTHTPLANADVRNSANCPVAETVQISVSFSGIEVDPTNLQGKLDGKIAELKKLAKEVGVENVSIQSTNYNVSSQMYGGTQSQQYQFSGSVSLTLQPLKKAEEFFVMLSKKGMQSSLNVSSYNNGGNCVEMSE